MIVIIIFDVIGIYLMKNTLPNYLPRRNSCMRILIFCACAISLNAANSATISLSLNQFSRTTTNGGMGTVDLTLGGDALDWIKTSTTALTFAEKDATSLLTLTRVGSSGGALTSFADDGFDYTWSGGTSSSPAGTSHAGTRIVNPTAAGNGFQVTYTAPAAGFFTINLYTAATAPQKWTLSGTIGSTSQSLTPDVRSGTQLVDELFWTISGVADNAGQVLTLNLLSNTGTSTGSLAILGVTAVPEPSTTGLFIAGTLIGLIVMCRGRKLRNA